MHEVNPEGVFKQLERVTRERDEAKRWLVPMDCGHIAYDRVENDGCAVCALHDSRDEAERERDEARAVLREVWCGDLGCPFAVCKKIKVALGPLPEKQTEGK